MTIWDSPDTWQDLARLAQPAIPDGQDRMTVEVRHGDVRYPAPDGRPDPHYEPLFTAVGRLGAQERLVGLVLLDIGRDGRYAVRRLPPARIAPEVLIDPTARPPILREPAPAPGPPLAASDPEQVAAAIASRLGDGEALDEPALADFAEELGRPIPPELRAAWRTVGDVEIDDEHYFRLEQPSAEALRMTRQERFIDAWLIPVDHRPEDEVLHVPFASGWIPFADDGDGNASCLDLTPGAAGAIGQVVRVDLDDDIGAHLVARSLLDFVEGRWVEEPPRPAPSTRLAAMIHHGSGITAHDLADATQLQVLQVGLVEAPVDLTPCLGLPAVHAISAASALAAPEQVLAFPALEYLALGQHAWTRLLDGGRLPGRLTVATIPIVPGQAVAGLAVRDRLRAAYGIPAEPTEPLLRGAVGEIGRG